MGEPALKPALTSALPAALPPALKPAMGPLLKDALPLALPGALIHSFNDKEVPRAVVKMLAGIMSRPDFMSTLDLYIRGMAESDELMDSLSLLVGKIARDRTIYSAAGEG